MSTREVQRDEWREFFDSFSQQHQGWLVTIEMLGPDLGDQVEARQLPLEGITVESGDGGDTQIEIIAGHNPDSHISHTVTSPKRVWLKQTEEGADEALEIESADSVVLLRFRSALRSEMVDGII
jgi:hypothetical protein